MNKLQRSWVLFKSSLTVMSTHRKLLLFPVVTTFFTLLVAALFLTPVAFQNTGHSITSLAHWETSANIFYDTKNLSSDGQSSSVGQNRSSRHSRSVNGDRVRPLGIVYFAVIYLASMYCATFFNVAFYNEILKALKGETVSIRGGIRFALTKWKSILLWTLFAGAVGMIIKGLEERFGFVGRLVLRLLGTAWSIACVFVIPVIIREEEAVSPISVLKKSASTLKQTWGESMIGYAGVSLGGGIFLLFSLFWLGAGAGISYALGSMWLMAFVFAGWMILVFAASYLMGTASQIFRCALFLYATEGFLPLPYNQEMVELAWKVKK